MTSVVRYTLITNPAAAILTVADANSGDDFSRQLVKRVFRADDIGAGAGQTRDATDPTTGCLVAQFSGSRVMDVLISSPYRTAAATNRNFTGPVLGTGANTSKVDYRVSFDANSGISSIYIFDRAAAAPGQIVAADWIFLEVLMGRSANPAAAAQPLG